MKTAVHNATNLGRLLLATAALTAVPAGVLLHENDASAAVRHSGDWPGDEKPISLDLDGVPAGQAIRKLAAEAGWSIVLHGVPTSEIDVHVEEQSPSKVLDLILIDGAFVAHREGTIVSIDLEKSAAVAPAPQAPQAPVAAPAPHAPASAMPPPAPAAAGIAPMPPVPPMPSLPGVAPMPPMPSIPGVSLVPSPDNVGLSSDSGGDRVRMWSNLVVAEGETAKDAVVMGGRADIYGTVTHDLVVIAGSAVVHPGAHIHGGAVAVGGSVHVESGARVDGDTTAVGGMMRTDEGAILHGMASHTANVIVGETSRNDKKEHGKGKAHTAHGTSTHDDDDDDDKSDGASSTAAHIGGELTELGVLFAFGTILIAFGGKRLNRLREETAVRPMRSLALGMVGSMALLAATIAGCLTLVGIPLVVLGLLFVICSVFASFCALLTVVGEGLVRHWSENPYVHLGVGCVAFLFASAIPYIGWAVVLSTTLISIGTLIGTRGAGYIPTTYAGQEA